MDFHCIVPRRKKKNKQHKYSFPSLLILIKWVKLSDSNKNNNLKNEEILLIWLDCDNNIDDTNLIKEHINNYIDECSYAFDSNDDLNLYNTEFFYKLKKLFEFK